MSRRKPKFEYAIICDDIRQEISNKFSFIGIYGPHILVTKIPYVFPKLCFAISYKDVEAGHSFSIKLIDPSSKRLGDTITLNIPKEAKKSIKSNMFAIFSPLNIKQEGSHKLVIICNDNDKWKQEVEFIIKLIDQGN